MNEEEFNEIKEDFEKAKNLRPDVPELRIIQQIGDIYDMDSDWLAGLLKKEDALGNVEEFITEKFGFERTLNMTWQQKSERAIKAARTRGLKKKSNKMDDLGKYRDSILKTGLTGKDLDKPIRLPESLRGDHYINITHPDFDADDLRAELDHEVKHAQARIIELKKLVEEQDEEIEEGKKNIDGFKTDTDLVIRTIATKDYQGKKEYPSDDLIKTTKEIFNKMPMEIRKNIKKITFQNRIMTSFGTHTGAWFNSKTKELKIFDESRGGKSTVQAESRRYWTIRHEFNHAWWDLHKKDKNVQEFKDVVDSIIPITPYMEKTKKANDLTKARIMSYATKHKMTEQDVDRIFQEQFDDEEAAGKNPRLVTFNDLMSDDGYYNEVHSEAGGFLSAFKEGNLTQKQLELIVAKVLSVSDMEKLVKAHNKLHGKLRNVEEFITEKFNSKSMEKALTPDELSARAKKAWLSRKRGKKDMKGFYSSGAKQTTLQGAVDSFSHLIKDKIKMKDMGSKRTPYQQDDHPYLAFYTGITFEGDKTEQSIVPVSGKTEKEAFDGVTKAVKEVWMREFKKLSMDKHGHPNNSIKLHNKYRFEVQLDYPDDEKDDYSKYGYSEHIRKILAVTDLEDKQLAVRIIPISDWKKNPKWHE